MQALNSNSTDPCLDKVSEYTSQNQQINVEEIEQNSQDNDFHEELKKIVSLQLKCHLDNAKKEMLSNFESMLQKNQLDEQNHIK